MNIGAAAIKTTILFEISPNKLIAISPDDGGATKQYLQIKRDGFVIPLRRDSSP